VHGNIPLDGSGPAAHLGEPATVGNGPQDQCLLVGGFDQTVYACGTAVIPFLAAIE